MTPVLAGRWQTRIILNWTVGLLIGLLFGLAFHRVGAVLVMLAYVTVIGLLLDVLYDFLQTLRWDDDWPPFLHVAGGVLEGALYLLLAKFLPVLPGLSQPLGLPHFVAAYAVIFLVTSLVYWNLMKVIFPQTRFRGGRIF